jgi:hypothetical protein
VTTVGEWTTLLSWLTNSLQKPIYATQATGFRGLPSVR